MEQTSTIGGLLKQAVQQLANLVDSDPRLEAEVLLAHVLNKPRTHLLAWPEKLLSTQQRRRFTELLQRRLKGEPLAYLTGCREFWSLPLRVTPDTLIPRPETELLVERALQLIPPEAAFDIVDLGTGSGAIAAAIASERPRCHILATDRSARALAVARENFRGLGLRNIRCAQGLWCDALPPQLRFELIVSNPPYVARDDPHLLRHGLDWEPAGALSAGPDGLDDLRQIIDHARRHLKPGGWLLLEHGLQQGGQVRALMRNAGYLDPATSPDLGGRDRVSQGRMPAVPGSTAISTPQA